MQEKAVTDALLREFLLGKVDEDDREQIESLFLTDSRTRERILIAEQDLIEEYLEDGLTTTDNEKFVSRFAQTEAQQTELQITKSLKERARTALAIQPSIPPGISPWARVSERLRLRPIFILPILVILVVAIAVTVFMRGSRQQGREKLLLEQELAQLNTASRLREVPPKMISLTLSPLTVRSIENATEFKPRGDVEILELRLLWVQKQRYALYQVQLRRLGDEQSFTIRNLQAEGDGQYVISVRLPAHILTHGEYQLHLTGITTDGSAGSEEDYTLTVGV